MSSPSGTPEERFATIVEELLNHPGVTPPSNGKAFGSFEAGWWSNFRKLVWMRSSLLAMESALIPDKMVGS